MWLSETLNYFIQSPVFAEKILKPSAVDLANTEKAENSPNLKNYFNIFSFGLGAQI